MENYSGSLHTEIIQVHMLEITQVHVIITIALIAYLNSV